MTVQCGTVGQETKTLDQLWAVAAHCEEIPLSPIPLSPKLFHGSIARPPLSASATAPILTLFQAKKRHLIDKRLQDRLRKETDSVKRAEEAKKDKHTANRKEEEIQLKNTIHRLRRLRLPVLANFLLTSDVIPSDDSSPPPSHKWTLEPSRSHPPPLYYLPAVLTPSQEAFIAKRKAEAAETAEKEWSAFLDERDTAINEVRELQWRVSEEEARKQVEREAAKAEDDTGPSPVHNTEKNENTVPELSPSEPRMDVDETITEEGHGPTLKQDGLKPDEPERKDDPTAMQAPPNMADNDTSHRMVT
ncbi:hypothetical protein F5888DRAFT_1804429 [Russula emetica]|nr:hypothetical protein F5888DRAFT_1804429 [Russula emetica]